MNHTGKFVCNKINLAFVSFLALCACTTVRPSKESLRESTTLYASFDRELHAEHAHGDRMLYGAVHRGKPQEASPGLPKGDDIQLALGEGRVGNALRFTKKSDAMVYFKGPGNFDYQRTNWSGSISFWMKLDPDKDLQPGYCDPLQVSAGSWNDGVFFAEFSKDNPRHFRFAMRPLQQIWNPDNAGWEDIPVEKRPMVDVAQPPFGSDRWTHVVFTFENANTGENNGVGRLYLNGKFAGEFPNWKLTVNWDPKNMLVSLGVFYVGLMDEVALFNRALNEKEIEFLYKKPERLRLVLQ